MSENSEYEIWVGDDGEEGYILDRTMGVEGEMAEAGLVEIARIDRTFNVARFLSGAQEAFTMIVEAFADGDRETLRGLLSDSVYGAFERAITTREQNGEQSSVEIHAIRKSEIVDAHIDGRVAFITVRFVADETNILRDKDGKLLSGDPDRVTETIDIWTFTRDVRSRDPAWLLCETSDEDAQEDEQKTVPDHQNL